MQPQRRKRTAGLAVASAGVLALAAAGCGSDDEEKSESQAAKPRTVKIDISGSAKKPKLTVPASVEGGLVTIQVTNNAKGKHGAQLIAVDGDHTPEEALKAGNAWGQGGKPLPPWLKTVGGVGAVEPGQTGSVTQSLPAGDYVVFDLDTDSKAPLKVSGGGASGEPSAPSTITAHEYNFKSSGLKAGKQKVLFDNAGKEPHFIAGVRMNPGATIDEVRKFFQTEKGQPPISEEGGFDTAVTDGGNKQTVEVNLEKGKYALLCFVPDRKGGPPHAVKGMISEAVVE